MSARWPCLPNSHLSPKRKAAMNFVKADIYLDAFWYFIPFKYMGLCVYSLSKNYKHTSVKITDAVITIIIISCATAFAAYYYADCQKDISMWLFSLMFKLFHVQVVCALINAHLQSRNLMELFRVVNLVDAKIASLNDATSLKMEKQKLLHITSLFRYGILAAAVAIDAGFVVLEGIPARFFLCSGTRFVSALWRIQSGCLHIFFIAECTRRLKHINNSIKKLLMAKRKISSIETNVGSKTKFGYKMEEAKLAICRVMDVVAKANHVFEFDVLLKVGQIFLSVLVLGYFAADTYFFNKSLTESQSTLHVFYLLTHAALHCLDLFIDIWFYRLFEEEVSISVIFGSVLLKKSIADFTSERLI